MHPKMTGSYSWFHSLTWQATMALPRRWRWHTRNYSSCAASPLLLTAQLPGSKTKTLRLLHFSWPPNGHGTASPGLHIRSLPVQGPPNNSDGDGSPYINRKLHSLVAQTMLCSSGRSWCQDHFCINFYGLAGQRPCPEASTPEFTYLLLLLSQDSQMWFRISLMSRSM